MCTYICLSRTSLPLALMLWFVFSTFISPCLSLSHTHSPSYNTHASVLSPDVVVCIYFLSLSLSSSLSLSFSLSHEPSLSLTHTPSRFPCLPPSLPPSLPLSLSLSLPPCLPPSLPRPLSLSFTHSW